MENYVPLSDLQAKTYHDAVLAYQAFQQALKRVAQYPGWRYFKKVGSREYLFHALDRRNNGKSLGARSPETEKVLADWQMGREAAEQAFNQAAVALEQHKRFCKAARLGRLPTIAAKILRRLEKAGAAEHFVVIGTHALYAYEAMAGVHFVSDLTATKDFDILWDSRQHLVFAEVDGEPTEGLMDVLKKVDKTFTRNEERTFQAINASGFAVEILRPEEPKHPPLIAPSDRINPMALAGLDYLLAPALIQEIVIAEDGYPLMLRVPDPAAYVLHKLWVSARDDRRPEKAARDHRQAQALAALINERLPLHGFDIDRIQAFPAPLLDHLDQVL